MMQRGTRETAMGSKSGNMISSVRRAIVVPAEPGKLQVSDLHTRDQEERANLMRVIEENRGRSSALISVLHGVQNSMGHIPVRAQHTISKEMGIPFSTVHGVVTFYNFFSQQPKGEYTVQICQGTACYVRGGRRILQQLGRKLGIRPGETTKDGKFSLEVVRCLGCCGLSPVMAIGGNVYRRMNPKKVTEILEGYT